jgi:hypothetical protein
MTQEEKYKSALNPTKAWSREAEEVAERLAEILIMQVEDGGENKEASKEVYETKR